VTAAAYQVLMRACLCTADRPGNGGSKLGGNA